METASEQAADEAALVLPDGPNALADCLVKLGRQLVGTRRVGWLAADGSGLRSGLARRVQLLLGCGKVDEACPRSPTALARPMAAGLLILVAVFCTLWVHPKASSTMGDDTMNVLKVSWRQSVAAAALTVLLGPAGGALAEEQAPAPPKPVQLEQGSPADLILLAQGEKPREADRPREGEKRPEAAGHAKATSGPGRSATRR